MRPCGSSPGSRAMSVKDEASMLHACPCESRNEKATRFAPGGLKTSHSKLAYASIRSESVADAQVVAAGRLGCETGAIDESRAVRKRRRTTHGQVVAVLVVDLCIRRVQRGTLRQVVHVADGPRACLRIAASKGIDELAVRVDLHVRVGRANQARTDRNRD